MLPPKSGLQNSRFEECIVRGSLFGDIWMGLGQMGSVQDNSSSERR